MKKLSMIKQVSITFEQGCDKYILNCKQRNLRQGTIRHYQQSYTQFYKYFDRKMLLCEITEQILRSLLLQLRTGGYYLFDNPGKFALRPDIVITRNSDNAKFIMDTKWKLLCNSPQSNYGIYQGDMYQMYAYQKKYVSNSVTLLYPVSDSLGTNENIVYTSQDNVKVNVRFIDLFNQLESIDQILKSTLY